MQPFEALKNLVLGLKKEEVVSIEKHLNTNQLSQSLGKSKSFVLVKNIREINNLSYKDALAILYPDNNKVAFNKLIKRLHSKVLEILILDSSITSGNYSLRNSAIFKMRKKMIQIEILNLRGIDIDIQQNLNKIILNSKKYETFDILLHALHTKQKYLYSHGNKAKFDKVKLEIQTAEKYLSCYNRSENLFNEMLKHINLNEKSSLTEQTLLTTIEKIETDFNFTKSAIISYYLLMLKTEFSQRSYKYLESLEYLLKLKEIIKKKDSVYTRNRYGTIILNIANNYLLVNDFRNCNKYLEESEKLFSDVPINLGLVKELTFFSKLNEGKLDEASAMINLLLSDTKSGTSIMMSKRKYYQAVVKFILGEFDQSVELLNSLVEIEKDKEGWNFGIKLMQLLNYIELKDRDKIEYSIQNIERYIKRVVNKYRINTRLIIIFKILRSLHNSNLSFKETLKHKRKLFEKLKSDLNLAWYLRGPEIFNFESWFLCKVHNKVFIPGQMHLLLN